MDHYLATIDCGTTGAKAIIFDLDGNRQGMAYTEYLCEFPSPVRVEQDAEQLFNACVEVLKNAVKSSGVRANLIKALSFSTQRCTVIPVDRDCRPIRKAISWQDNRSDSQCEFIRDKIGEEKFYAITGLPIANVWALPSIMWIRDNEPSIYETCHKFLNPHGFLMRRFGADDFVEDLSNASLHGLVSITDFVWHPELIDLTGISDDKLPKLVSSGSCVGHISSSIADATGLSVDTILVAGGGDQQCAAIGSGVVKPGMCEITLGTAGVAICSFEQPPFDPDRRIPAELHAYPGKWICEGLQSTAGASLKWLRNIVAEAGQNTQINYDRLNVLAADIPAGSDCLLFLPYLAGAGAPQWNGNAKATFHGLTQGHSLGTMVRAIMEGVAYQNALILQEFEKSGHPLTDIRITGGGARSELWSQIQADVYGKPVNRLAEDEAGLLGAAILAGFGTGVFETIDDGIERMVKMTATYTPDGITHDIYKTALDQYQALYQRLYQ